MEQHLWLCWVGQWLLYAGMPAPKQRIPLAPNSGGITGCCNHCPQWTWLLVKDIKNLIAIVFTPLLPTISLVSLFCRLRFAVLAVLDGILALVIQLSCLS
ncbi:hypothetical protein VNO77_42436 [Canavalia gladiata]|uniref:Uncharacterized protein n=1 Tax=Canavalia gladiata TaxID=3824 RepID=A0AAN9JSA9_CANGL